MHCGACYERAAQLRSLQLGKGLVEEVHGKLRKGRTIKLSDVASELGRQLDAAPWLQGLPSRLDATKAKTMDRATREESYQWRA